MPKGVANNTRSSQKGGRKKKRRVVETPVVEKRKPGRPRKVVTETSVSKSVQRKKGEKEAGKFTRKKRVHASTLLKAEAHSQKVSLPAKRMVEQLEGLLSRVDARNFRGRAVRPTLVVSLLEQQAIQESLALFQTKLSLQRSGKLMQSES